jgi:hypothetical protein
MPQFEFDEYEKKFVEQKSINAGEDAAPFQKAVIQAIIELWQDAWQKNPKLVNIIFYPNFLEQLIFWASRTTYFYEGISTLYRLSKEPNPILDSRIVCSMILPILPQELDGPVKEATLVLGYLKRITNGKNIIWSDYSTSLNKDGTRTKLMLGCAINEARDVFKSPSPLYDLIDGFDPQDHSIRAPDIRNCISHSNWIFIPRDK